MLATDNIPEIPLVFQNLVNIADLVNDTITIEDDKYIPYFWHIYRSAGETTKQLMGECLGLTLASSFTFPVDNLMTSQDKIRIMRFSKVKYFNVNLQTQAGIYRAKMMEITGQVETDLGPIIADALISPNINAVLNTLLSENDAEKYENRVKGAMFMISRNPIEREISNFYNVKATAIRSDIASYSLSDWFGLPFYMDNSMVRQLTNKMDPSLEVTMLDLFVAKEVLRQKCLIGLLEEKQETWNRFKQLFYSRWSLDKRAADEDCQERYLNWGWKNRNSMTPIIDVTVENELERPDQRIVDRATFRQIAALNRLDMLLYEYTKQLFWEQRLLFHEDNLNAASSKSNTTSLR